MASCSERTARGWLVALLLAIPWSQACATGAIFEAGRRTETVASYREAFTDGDRLWVVYGTETSNRDGEPVDRGSRTAVVALGDLDPARGHPLDALPLEHRNLARPPGAHPVALRGPDDPPARERGEPSLRVEEEDGRPASLALIGFEGLPADARLYSGSLIERRTAPWVYALLPLALAYDAVAVPTTAFFAIPFFVIGD